MQDLSILKKYLKEKNLDGESILEEFGVYFSLLEEWNKKFNLTAITSKDDVQTKHFIDSLLGNSHIQGCLSICDIGCGAGFPSIPLAIINKDIEFTLIDSVNKKINFIDCVVENLDLKNVKAFHTRVEDFAKNNFEKFDCCVARALAQMPTLLEYTLPLVKVGGKIVAYKGINYRQEIDNSSKILEILNSKIDGIDEHCLTNEEKRYIISVKKLKPCPNKYPRSGNKPRIQPILG